MRPHDELEVQALFEPDIDLMTVRRHVQEAGVSEEAIHVLSPIPLSATASDRIAGIPLYVVTLLAGLVGIGVGLFFAAGTAVMYPLMTGGKPIVAAPIVGIVSYETMMLVAIVTTFLTMIVKILSTNSEIRFRDVRIDEGRIAIAIRVPLFGTVAGAVREVLEQAGAIDVQASVIADGEETMARQIRPAAVVLLPILLAGALAGCSQDMQDQTSYQSQEAPRVHSPEGSIPRSSRGVLKVRPTSDAAYEERGALLFRINCVHCHGGQGDGDGPVAPYLKEPPANLKNDEVRSMSDEQIYRVLTEGKDMMPSFKGELSANERLDLARFVASLSRPATTRAAEAESP
jgi:mono/diheme cytochrome c family protein